QLVTGDLKGALRVWDSQLRRARAVREQAHSGAFGVMHVAQVSDREVASQGRDGFVRIWDLASIAVGDPVVELDTGSHGFCRASFHKSLVACTDDDARPVVLWDVKAGKRWAVDPPDADHGMLMAVRLSEDVGSARLYVHALYENGMLCTLDVQEQAWLDDMALKVQDKVPIGMDACFSAAKSRLMGLSCGADPFVTAFRADYGSKMSCKQVARVPLSGKTLDNADAADLGLDRRGCSVVRVRPDLRIFACGKWDGSVRLYDWHRMQYLGKLEHHSKSVQDIAFSADSTALAVAAEDGHVSMWRPCARRQALPLCTAEEDDDLDSAAREAREQRERRSQDDIFRDTPLRLLGYANEVGEAFRPVLPRFVRPSYAVAFSYVLADTGHKMASVEADRVRAGADTLVWQTFASVLLPGLLINRVVWVAQGAVNALPTGKLISAPVKRWAPVALGLGTIPFIVKPIDDFVHVAMDKSFRKIFP
ncbi:Mitochondrial fission process protein 1 (Mitochondrial 18 kDa protein) (MTP18), partial [Durusdinium trenchii]